MMLCSLGTAYLTNYLHESCFDINHCIVTRLQCYGTFFLNFDRYEERPTTFEFRESIETSQISTVIGEKREIGVISELGIFS